MSTLDLVCLGYNPWSRMWKRNQQIIWGLANEAWIGKVLFLNPAVWASSLVVDSRRSFDLLGRSRLRAIVPRRISRKITVATPLHLPLEGRLPALARAQSQRTDKMIWRSVTEPFVLVVNRPDDPAVAPIPALMERAALRVFDWSDDFATFASTERDRSATRSACEHYMRSSDVVIAVNDRLGARARAFCDSVHVVRNGTDAASFARVITGEVKAASAMRSLPRPIIGYMGYRVADRLDLALIDFLASSRPDWSFVFVGPKVGEEPLKEILKTKPNVRVVGPVEYTKLPSYIGAFDVCILPNKVNTHTAGNDPIKLYDYLAAGKPVVSTGTAGVEIFDGLVSIADTAPQFLQAIERALSTNSPEEQTRRHRAAEVHSWQAKSRTVADIMLSALAAKAVPDSSRPGEASSRGAPRGDSRLIAPHAW